MYYIYSTTTKNLIKRMEFYSIELHSIKYQRELNNNF